MPEDLLGVPFPAPSHDHGRCVDEALRRARAAFERKGLKFTPLREQIFREIAASHSADWRLRGARQADRKRRPAAFSDLSL